MAAKAQSYTATVVVEKENGLDFGAQAKLVDATGGQGDVIFVVGAVEFTEDVGDMFNKGKKVQVTFTAAD